jgi:hypothetical protein
VVSGMLFCLCHFVTENLLMTVSYMPRSLDTMVTINEFPKLIIVLYLSLMIFFAIWLHSRRDDSHESTKLFSYI